MAQARPLAERIPRLSRLSWLMGLYAENHRHLVRLFAPGDLEVGSYVSSVGDGLDVRLDVIARHAYTVELRLTYDLCDPVTGQPDWATVSHTDMSDPEPACPVHWMLYGREPLPQGLVLPAGVEVHQLKSASGGLLAPGQYFVTTPGERFVYSQPEHKARCEALKRVLRGAGWLPPPPSAAVFPRPVCVRHACAPAAAPRGIACATS